MIMISVSVPGKIILNGEHAVVYGEPAIIASVDKRIKVFCSPSDEIIVDSNKFEKTKYLELEKIIDDYKKSKVLWEEGFKSGNFSKLKKFISEDDTRILKNIIAGSLERFNLNGVHLKVHSEIPMGSGLGSSASLSVAVPRAISEAYDIKISNEENNHIAYEFEKLAHGTPSGADNSACCFGGSIWFQKNNDGTNTIKKINTIGGMLDDFILVYTTDREKTVLELVNNVRQLDRKHRDERLQILGDMSFELKGILENGNKTRLNHVLNTSHEALSELGVSTPGMDKISFEVKKIGGGAKISGGGGGGYMICHHSDRDLLCKLITEMGYRPEKVKFGVEGVTVTR